MSGFAANLLIAGAPKSGTSSLHAFLARQPDVCAADRKELHYFTPLTWGEAPAPFAEYVDRFRHCGGQRYRLEASPEYLYGGSAVAAAVNEQLPDARVIFILREPVQRMHSHFRHLQKSLRIARMPFAEFVARGMLEYERLANDPREIAGNVHARLVRAGIYAPFLEQWLTTCSAGRVRILFFDELRADPDAMLLGLLEWLGLPAPAPDDTRLEVINKGEEIRSQALHRHALRLYRALRPMLDRIGPLKETLRKAYQRINTVDDPQWQQTPEVQALRAFYEPFNASLRVLLDRLEYERLPGWIGPATRLDDGSRLEARAAYPS
jgi:hypothetical protein